MTKYGFYELDITPQLGCSIPGYFSDREVEDVLSNLYAKAIVADDGKNVSAICVIDAICVTDEICSKALASVVKRTGLDPQGILIQATHIHTGGPVIAGVGPTIAGANADHERGARYREWVIDRISDCITLAYKNREEMSAVYNIEKVYGISFVRNYIMKDGSVRTNPKSVMQDIVKPMCEADPDMPYLFFTDANGKARGALVNFACHHDCIGDTAVSADYSGILAKELRNKYGEDFICVFLNGFCGNINHKNFMEEYKDTPIERHMEMGKALADAVINSLSDAQKIDDEYLDYKKEIISVKRRSINPEIIERAKFYLNKGESVNGEGVTGDVQGERYLTCTAPNIIKYYGDDAPTEYDIYVQAIRLGDCIIYALQGEVYSQYGEYLKKNAPTDKVFLAELANGDSTYVPVAELYNSPDVYEATPTAGRLHEGGGMEMTKKAEELGNKLFK